MESLNSTNRSAISADNAMCSEFRYRLEKGNKKHLCISCGQKSLVRTVDTYTGQYLPEIYGRCDREVKCGYNLNPYSDGYAKMIAEEERGNKVSDWVPTPPPPKLKVIQGTCYIPHDIFKRTLLPEAYAQNTFLQNLLNHKPSPFDAKDVEQLISQYFIGTISKGYRSGAITFPYIDAKGNVRAIQAKQFDSTNHTVSTDYVHSILEKHYIKENKALPEWLDAYLKQDLKVSCFFGEHLLNAYPDNVIALVEAPKTVLYANLYYGFPSDSRNFLWLAVYNISSLTLSRAKSLEGRKVVLFPDLSSPPQGKPSAYELWSKKAEDFNRLLPNTQFVVSDLLEIHATPDQRSKGLDLADFLVQMDWREFRRNRSPSKVKKIVYSTECSDYPESWNETRGPEQKTTPLNKQYEGEIFNSLLSDLDSGAHFKQLQGRRAYHSLTDTPEELQAYFHKLSREYLPQLTKVQKLEFIRQRQQAGFTLLGIVEDFPGLGFRDEWALSQFLLSYANAAKTT